VLRVELDAAEPGMVLALPVRGKNGYGKVLLKIGYSLNAQTISRLQELKTGWVWVRCPSLNVLCKFFNEDIFNCKNQVVREIAETFDDLQNQFNTKLPYHAYRKSIREMIEHLVRNPQAAIFLGSLSDNGAEGLVGHSSRVTYLSLLMGLKLEGYLVRQRKRIHPVIAKEVTAMGLGAMLHDVGVLDLPEEVYTHYLETGDESDPQWREHPSIGFDRVRGGIDPSATTIVLNHHQRYDGSGWGGKRVAVLDRDRVHVFARIVGLADQFDKMLHPPHLPEQPTVKVLNELLQPEMAKLFDPHVVRSLLSVVPPYPPGSMVRLSDGRVGVCIDHIPVDPCRPVVQILPDIDKIDPDNMLPGEIVELYLEDETVFIVECDGNNVIPFNFPIPSLMKDQSQGLVLKRRGRVGLL